MLRPMVSRLVLVSGPHLGPKTILLLLSDRCVLMWVAHCHEMAGLSFGIAAGPRQRSHSQARVPRGLITICYCLRLENPVKLEGHIPVFISPRNRVVQLYPRALGPLTRIRWRYRNPPPLGDLIVRIYTASVV
jgi:hypothetical protein